jgi:hypothetical protein
MQARLLDVGWPDRDCVVLAMASVHYRERQLTCACFVGCDFETGQLWRDVRVAPDRRSTTRMGDTDVSPG